MQHQDRTVFTFSDYDSVKSRSRIRCLLNVNVHPHWRKAVYEGGDYRKLMPIGAFDDHEACEHVVHTVWRVSVGSHVDGAFASDLKWRSSPLSLVF
jgi:hypothetical protein